MAEVTVADFAKVLKVPVDRLLVQLDEAGIKVGGADDVISEDAKLELLTHLRKSHGRKDAGESAPRRITLNRKSSSELKLGSSQGRARTVNVEVRQKRTYIKRDVLEEQARQATRGGSTPFAAPTKRLATPSSARRKRSATPRSASGKPRRRARPMSAAGQRTRSAALSRPKRRLAAARRRAQARRGVREGSGATRRGGADAPEGQEGADGHGAR
jgi:translation initiation factor IF-2